MRPVRRALRRLRYALLASLLAAALALLLARTSPMRSLELRLYDERVRATHNAVAPDTQIVVVAIDENSLQLLADRLGRWPWPRDVHAALVDYLAYAGARAIVFDILFPEPDLRDRAADSVFAQSVADAGNVVLPLTLSHGDTAAERRLRGVLGDQTSAGLARFGEPGAAAAAHRFEHAEPPFAELLDGAASAGVANFNSDGDAISRRERLAYAYDGRLYPALALAAARVAAPERFGGPLAIGADEVRSGAARVPLHDGRYLIRWRGAFRAGAGESTYRVIPAFAVLNSYQQVLAGETPDVPAASLRDRIVFVALTGAGLLEMRPNPLGARDPGVLVHATLLDDLLRGDHFRRAAALWHWLAPLALALLVGVLAAGAGSLVAGSLAAAAAILAALLANVLLFRAGVWLDLAAMLAAGALSYAGAMGASYLTEGRERRRIRELFSRYVPPEYVRRLADDFENLRLGGERAEITVLFSDIRNFTALSERLPPERVVSILNAYLERMAAVVFRHGGTLDKFIGDAVMAFWGAPLAAPDHARRAVDAALEMQAELAGLNRELAAESGGVELRIGIGVNTGPAVVGNIGSLAHKLDYTAIGDTVNLASRLEGLNKELGTEILIGDATRAALGAGFELRERGEVRVKGKEQSVKVHELLARKVTHGASAVALALALLCAASDAHAQQRARWTDWVYAPGSWVAGRLVPAASEGSDSLALLAVVETYSAPPRWRAEVRAVEGGRTKPEPLVLVGDGKQIVVLTGLGATPLEKHAAASDPVVRGVVARFANGRPVQTAARHVERGASGATHVTVRKRAVRADFPDELLASGRAGRFGRNLLRMTVREAAGAREGEVAVSAGARGVTKVRTARGEIEVEPNVAAIVALDAIAIDAVELDEFLRAAGLGGADAEDAE